MLAENRVITLSPSCQPYFNWPPPTFGKMRSNWSHQPALFVHTSPGYLTSPVHLLYRLYSTHGPHQIILGGRSREKHGITLYFEWRRQESSWQLRQQNQPFSNLQLAVFSAGGCLECKLAAKPCPSPPTSPVPASFCMFLQDGEIKYMIIFQVVQASICCSSHPKRMLHTYSLLIYCILCSLKGMQVYKYKSPVPS